MTDTRATMRMSAPHRAIALVIVCTLSLGLFVTVLSGGVAADTPAEPDLQCVGSGGGIPYTTDSNLTIYENHTAGINQFYFPTADTVRFDYATGAVNLSSTVIANARLESVAEGTVCLADISATDSDLVVQPDSDTGIGVTGFSVDLAFRDPVFESTDEGVDLVYSGSPYSLTLIDTEFDEGQTVWAYDSEGVELENVTVTGGTASFSQLPSEGSYGIDFVADIEAEEDEDSSATSSSSSRRSSSDSSTQDETTVTAVDTVDTTDESDETGDESDGTTETDESEEPVRVSSASASVRGGSTLEITLPPTEEGDGPADGEDEQPTDEAVDEADQPTDDGTTDDDTTDDGATDGGAGDGEADSDPNQPPPPPVSQAEIERVEIDVNEDVDAEVEIRQSRSPPSDDASEFQRNDGTQAAGYIQVTDNLDDDQVTEGRLTFRVSKSDLETDAADPENVALYHYIPETGEWEELDTEVVGETDDFVRFRGTTPGFSQFAAGIKRAQFEISDALVNVQQISLGDSIQVEAIVTNTGGADGTFTTQLLVDGAVVAEDVLTIASGGQRATIFDHEFDQADTYQVRVNDVITGEIQVTDPNAAAESTDDFLPGFGFGTALLTLVVSTLLYRRRAR